MIFRFIFKLIFSRFTSFPLPVNACTTCSKICETVAANFTNFWIWFLAGFCYKAQLCGARRVIAPHFIIGPNSKNPPKNRFKSSWNWMIILTACNSLTHFWTWRVRIYRKWKWCKSAKYYSLKRNREIKLSERIFGGFLHLESEWTAVCPAIGSNSL